MICSRRQEEYHGAQLLHRKPTLSLTCPGELDFAIVLSGEGKGGVSLDKGKKVWYNQCARRAGRNFKRGEGAVYVPFW